MRSGSFSSVVVGAVVGVCCGALLGAGEARAVTAVLPVDAAGMGADEARVRKEITEVLRDVLRGSFQAVPDPLVVDGAARCAQTMACLVAAAAAVGAEEVVWVKAERAAPSQGAAAFSNVRLALFSSDGTPLATFDKTLSTTTAILDLRGVIVQAFDPASYAGRASVTGLVPGDELLIDGLRPERAELALRAGPHQARVRHSDGSVVDVDFVVPFQGQVTVDARAPAAAAAGGAPPGWWPGVVHGGAAVVGVAGLATVIGRELVLMRPAADRLDRGACPSGGDDPSGGDFQNQGVSSLGPCGGVQVELHQWVQLNRDLHVTLGAGFTLLALAAGTAAAATLLAAPEEPPATGGAATEASATTSETATPTMTGTTP